MMEYFAIKSGLLRHVEGETVVDVNIGSICCVMGMYFKFTISPVRISAAAAATRRGVRRLRRPSWIDF